MVIIYKLTKDKKMGDIYRRILVVAPVAICIFTFVLNILCRNNEELNTKMEKLLTGRVLHMNSFMDNVGFNMLGIVPAESFDSMYFHLLYNYGWVLFIAVILAYTIAMWYCYKEKLHYELIAMAAMSVYGFMEFMPLSVVWNFTIICLSYVVFRRKNKADERLQQKVSDY
jgi:magnesium-transporting ATPase (P-type)